MEEDIKELKDAVRKTGREQIFLPFLLIGMWFFFEWIGGGRNWQDIQLTGSDAILWFGFWWTLWGVSNIQIMLLKKELRELYRQQGRGV